MWWSRAQAVLPATVSADQVALIGLHSCDDDADIGVNVPGERQDSRRVVAGVLAVAGTYIGVGVDPEDRQVIAVHVDEV